MRALKARSHGEYMIEEGVDCAQQLFRYADPLFVTVEAAENLAKQGMIRPEAMATLMESKWYGVLLTTRTLLAHAVLEAGHSSLIVDTIAGNIRALLRLVNVDIAEKFVGLRANETAWYKPIQQGKSWLPMKSLDLTVRELSSTTHSDLSEEFTALQDADEDVRRISNRFGHAVYVLVATRDNLWKREARQYAVLTT